MAGDLGVEKVIFDSDSQTYIDCFSGKALVVPWRIHGLVHEFSPCLCSHPSWSFHWVPRGANAAPHVLAGWCLSNCLWGLFDSFTEPPIFVNTCSKDLSQVPSALL